MSIIPTLRRLRQEDCEFEARLEYIMRSFLKKQNKRKKIKTPERLCFDSVMIHVL
jgi:hypothetical protein